MKISDIKFRKSLTGGTLKAVASLTIDGCIAIHELKVIETDHLFVAMPSRKDESGNYHDIVHPINESARNLIETAVLSAYKIYADSQAMNITDIIFRKTFDIGKLRAVVSITIDGCLAIHEIKLIQTDHLFIAMPYRTDSYGISHDIVHPIGEAARHELESAIIGAYKDYVAAHEPPEIENFTA